MEMHFEGLRMLENSPKLAQSGLVIIAKICGDWAWPWPIGSLVPTNRASCWDQGAWKFMKFRGIITVSMKEKRH